MLQKRSPPKAPWLQFLATWLLSSLVLSAVHGLGIGTFLGLAIATGYLAAVHWRPMLMRGRLQRPYHTDDNPPAPHTYNTERSRLSSVGRAPDL